MVSTASNCGQTPRLERAAARERVTEDCSTKTSPPELKSGLTSPRMTEMVVDLPAPLGPSKAKTWPCGTPKVTLSTAVLRPKVLVRLTTCRPSVLLTPAALVELAEDLTRTSSWATSSSEMPAASWAAVGGAVDGLRLKSCLRVEPGLPASIQTRMMKRMMDWMIRYRIGPPYWRIPPGYEARSSPSHAVEKRFSAMKRARVSEPIGAKMATTKCTTTSRSSTLSTGP